MPSTIGGLPLHPLIVHATTVLVPLAALVVLLAVLWPRFRRWAGPLPVGLALVALVLTPLSTATGEDLEHEVGRSALVERHAELGDQLLPLTIALFVLAAVFWWLERRPDTRRALVLGAGALAVVAALATGVQVVRIGHSGAEAAWSGTAATSG
ncbi:DUF2231 domain-containing protein [Nocardioides mangrovi]|uniref:DUF2231 domain-containing protein n=1 Tax=Nocardioides mangrovi TaxID=2874580 RepID=A0ABS7UA66_9ACTN|nr:DUF2231 domain-containing protein [Nocardioides mangrovi]MBZ5737884.1 hypothetical protein [Nocardioides mangrovi]